MNLEPLRKKQKRKREPGKGDKTFMSERDLALYAYFAKTTIHPSKKGHGEGADYYTTQGAISINDADGRDHEQGARMRDVRNDEEMRKLSREEHAAIQATKGDRRRRRQQDVREKRQASARRRRHGR